MHEHGTRFGGAPPVGAPTSKLTSRDTVLATGDFDFGKRAKNTSRHVATCLRAGKGGGNTSRPAGGAEMASNKKKRMNIDDILLPAPYPHLFDP